MKKINIVLFIVALVVISFYLYDRQNRKINTLEEELKVLTEQLNLVKQKESALQLSLNEANKKLEKLTKSKKSTTPVSVKKKNFKEIMIKPLNEVFDELKNEYLEVKKLINNGVENEKIAKLREFYKVQTNEELLYALKPHPKSIALAQGAMESAWAESRFFKKANNIFGVWSFNKNEPRIAASGKRGEKTIWLKKYATIKDAIKDYYITLSRSSAFKEFRKLNYEDASVYDMVEKLHRYSEKKEAYGDELKAMIKFNNFTKYDSKILEDKKAEIKNEQTEIKKEQVEEVKKENIKQKVQKSLPQEEKMPLKEEVLQTEIKKIEDKR